VTPEVSVKRKTLSVVTLAVALFAAVVLQLTVVNRLPLPGGAVPDLVLLLVTAIAVATTPGVAAVTGFAGGLALDVAPPAAHYAGQYALVFCLAGYAASRVYRAITNTSGEQDRVVAFTVMASAAAAGEAGKAALGMLLSDPDVTTASVSHVLPGAILYDLVLAPLVFLLVARVTRGAVPDRAPAPEFSREQRLASVFRPASTGAAPNLRLAGTGMSFSPRTLPRRVPSLRLSGTGETYRSQPVAGRAPKLRLAGTSSPSLSRTAASFSGSSQFPLAAGRARKLNFAGDLPVRTGARPPRAPGKNWLRSTTTPALSVRKSPVHVPARGWLGSATPSGQAGRGAAGRTSPLAGVRIGRRMGDVINGHAATGGTRRRRKSAHPRHFASGTLGAARPGASSIAPRVPRTAAETLAARYAPSGLSALSGAGTPLTGRRSPQAGWLSGGRSATTPAVRKAPRSGWLGSTRSRPRAVIGSVVGGRAVVGGGLATASRRRRRLRRRATVGGNWYTASPSGAWLRRGQHQWRKRSQRLLQMVGVVR
jgi:rod shape-determining protein MreD